MRWLISSLVLGIVLLVLGFMHQPEIAEAQAQEPATPARSQSSSVALMQVRSFGHRGKTLIISSRSRRSEWAKTIEVRGSSMGGEDETAAAIQMVQRFARWKWEKNWPEAYEIWLSGMSSTYPEEDGITLALPAALAVEGLINGPEYDPKFGCTGALTEHGFVEPVAEVRQRVLAASSAGLTHIALPKGNLPDLLDMVIGGTEAPITRVQVFLVDGYYETRRLALASPDRDSVLNEAMRLYEEVRDGGVTQTVLAQPKNVLRLEKILELEPGHFSARYLLSVAKGTEPTMLSLRGAVYYLDRLSARIDKVHPGALGGGHSSYTKLRTHMPKSAYPSMDVIIEMSTISKKLVSPLLNPNQKGALESEFEVGRKQFREVYAAFKASKEVMAIPKLAGQLED